MAPDAQKLDFPADLPPMRVQYRYGNIPVVYEFLTVGDLSTDDYLPSYLAMRPQVGDVIMSKMDRRFEVKQIAHVLDGREAAVRLSVGRPDGGQTPVSGGPATSQATEEL